MRAQHPSAKNYARVYSDVYSEVYAELASKYSMNRTDIATTGEQVAASKKAPANAGAIAKKLP